ncbi:hypothetical protein PtrSN002B_011147 [Pyrenophora tritici-repentis]|uniref:DUF7605 domain-containing protein n=1 Tax=Pyrenophora tritici-repentis TaxID=45151 RepID=A0A2W1GD68_9PLEO|nr:hypothetical protein PtrV1_04911 [Pyrenophora tritici-repentis]KAF7574251.1 hypothetical protein PtrM4_058740 [Pyrenophora tritici-repentis]KAI1518344.1 hypothetical protein Ptr86124_001472 [Pyrenophora tritici-repentis]KAI1524220.1 hypothetical protein PtrSN001A_010963 [Pyrenophora tritici-repentis]KAI1524473.1 hypothetical protein PtrSN001C_011026 [Pyrenophora tritici-repentis]
MTCTTTTENRVDHLVNIVQGHRENLRARILALMKRFATKDIKQLYDALSHQTLQAQFDSRALHNLRIWENLSAATHRTACNKKGIYTQKKKHIYLNWDESLFSPVKQTIDQAFRSIVDGSVETFKAEASQASKEVIRKLDHDLKNDPRALACNAYKICFKGGISGLQEEVENSIEVAARALKNEMTKIHVRSASLKKEDYFPQAMAPIYEAAYNTKSATKNSTLYVARKAYLRNAIPGPNGPFPKIASRAKAHAEAVIGKVSRGLGENLDELLLAKQEVFEMMKSRKENDTPAGQKFCSDLDPIVKETRRILDGVVKESLDLCKQYK